MARAIPHRIVLVVVGLYVRMKIAESPVFEKVKESRQEAKLPIVEAITKHWKNMLLAMGARFAENGVFYIFATFSIAYAVGNLKLSKASILTGVLIAAAIETFTIPLFGLLSDKVGRKPVYMFGAVFSGLMAFPFFWLFKSLVPEIGWIGLILGLAVGHAAMYGPQASFFSELFSSRLRYSGTSLGYQLASIFAGALSPLIATALLIAIPGATWPVSLYIVGLALITVISLVIASETFKEQIE